MSIRVRFAPSPTGALHVGNIRVALVNWLLARRSGGSFLLRFDDTDQERSKPEYVDGIRRDLAWLGLGWDEEAFQSGRLADYDAAFERLKQAGRVYPCWETPEELDYKRNRQRARGRPPVYDRAALSLSDEEKARHEAEGRKPHWRFLLDGGEVAWNDGVRGPSKTQMGSISDPVVKRADGTYLYMLPSAVDDIAMEVTDVVRGEDHVTNTAVQIQMFHALGGEPPRFSHLPLLVDAEGKGLSKRLGSLSMAELRNDGLEPGAVTSLLARLGTADPVEPRQNPHDLAAEFDITRFGRAPARFDPADLDQINARLLHEMTFGAAGPRLVALGIPTDAAEPFWHAIRPNITRFAEARDWWKVVTGPVAPVIEDEDREFIAAARALLPPEPWDAETWTQFVSVVKTETGRKGKGLFMPLRKALTGLAHGPELKPLLPLIGRARADSRLAGETA
ncbi:Glutamyl-tRNA(Gln) synthetase [Caenispirillum salinarum AK4]|uniref:Glutamate--tRNA ligase n=1 Tax=Caenispirillum salinarum AK4 TaxID=1238182 RepID=K9HRG4_9PROT|nr:glutamate--tRNA ligase [Caenispirillum salinarum]EKV32883.1 Glutamyl-tRNA(Gln) synthetase [Caenispirillum salinarum AK4]